MSTFTERKSPTTTVKTIPSLMPHIFITSTALSKMQVYVETCADEVGWLGTVQQAGNQYLIDDVYLFDQEVHATTTEITPEGLSDFATELLEQPDGMEIWNKMKMWGHSHVNMGVTPSGQDDSQMITFSEGGHDWFIRLIANKKGEMKLDLYDYANGLIYIDVPWTRYITDQERTIQEQIDALQKQMDDMHKGQLDIIKTPIQEEMKVKVRKKSYQTSYSQGYWQNGKWIPYTYQKNQSVINVKNETKSDVKNETQNKQISLSLFNNAEDVRKHFKANELRELSYCTSVQGISFALRSLGYDDDEFSWEDMVLIHEVADEYFYNENTQIGRGYSIDY